MSPPSEWAGQQATLMFELVPLGTTAEEFICRIATSLDAAKAEGAREAWVPLCIGRETIRRLAQDGQVSFDDGRSLIAASDLYHATIAYGAREAPEPPR